MPEKVFITGVGIISSIGKGIDETIDSLKNSRSGIGVITLLETAYKNELPAAEVKATHEDLMEIAGIKDKRPYSRTALLGIIAARQALRHAFIDDIAAYRTGLISATTVGGMDKSEVFYRPFIENKRHGRLRDIITHDCGDSTETIADYTGIRDYVSTVSTACSSSANALLLGARLIKNGLLQRVLVGGVDALTLFTINGFNSLMILDKNPCRPFDEERNGLNLGEGAGFLMLEAESIAEKEKKSVLCEISGYGNACDAFHQTASSPEGDGAYLSMKKALDTARLEPSMIDYINAHGTGTKNNDLSEGKAIERLFGNTPPPCSSTKAYTGHTLGAAGAVEAVFCVLAIQNGIIYPNLRFQKQMSELSFSPVVALQNRKPLKHIMSNSFGFGGNNTSLIFSAI